jgi:uncharacterized integral membrane protein
MAIVWLLLGAVLVVIGSVFYAQNPTAVDLYLWTLYLPRVPLWLVAAVPGLVGLLLGFLLTLPGRVRRTLAVRRLSAQIQERDRTIGRLQERVNELERDLPVARPARTSRVPVVEEPRLPDVPDVRDGTRARTDLSAA